MRQRVRVGQQAAALPQRVTLRGHLGRHGKRGCRDKQGLQRCPSGKAGLDGLGQVVPVTEAEPNTKWDDGLSPNPLFSFYHESSRIRHWSFSAVGDSFLCQTERINKHHKGGDLFMDMKGGICKVCVRTAKSHERVAWSEYVASECAVSLVQRHRVD